MIFTVGDRRSHLQLENIWHSLDTKIKKSTSFASNQVRELRSFSQLLKIYVKSY
ncbi:MULTISPECIES: hypothetical protein [unclassified Microcoleus]|uniref:hypothetical protein n=1 Tax=unclassified Microcoleus TaxID=2642155 RepID=UPI002FD76A82